MFWVQLLRFLLTAAVMGLLAHIIGEALPRRWFRAEAFPYRAYAWEQNGKFYQKLGIRAWKDRLPDKSRLVRSAYRKSVAAHHEAGSMDRLVQETCVAECVHTVLFFLSPVFLVTMARPYGGIAAALYALSHIPFIMIQRYNRPRLCAAGRLARALSARKPIPCGAGADEAAPVTERTEKKVEAI